MNQAAAPEHEDGRKRYEDFLLREYDNIAQAHHKRMETISIFFRHYLLIISLPIPLLALALSVGGPKALAHFLANLGLPLAIGATMIGLIGLCVMAYIASLRFSCLLYARTINAIRSYFAQRSGLSDDEVSRSLVLPRSEKFPPYREWGGFGFIVYALALLDAAYFAGGWALWLVATARSVWWWLLIVAIFVAVFAGHVLLYHVLACRREKRFPPGSGVEDTMHDSPAL